MPPRHTASLLLVLLTHLFPTSTASATHLELMRCTVVTEYPGDACLLTVPFIADIGMYDYSLLYCAFRETGVFSEAEEDSQRLVDVNALTTEPPVVVSGDIGGMRVDLTALSAHNGEEPDQRARTLRIAKLALVAIARNLDELTSRYWHTAQPGVLTVELVGLPPQDDLPGTPLPPAAELPYPNPAQSPLLNALETELINAEGGCPPW